MNLSFTTPGDAVRAELLNGPRAARQQLRVGSAGTQGSEGAPRHVQWHRQGARQVFL